MGRRGGGVDNDIFFGCLWEMILSFRGFFLCLEVERGYGGYIFYKNKSDMYFFFFILKLKVEIRGDVKIREIYFLELFN